MEKKIIYYQNGEKINEEELTLDHIEGFHGMKVRCQMKDGTEQVGYADVFFC